MSSKLLRCNFFIFLVATSGVQLHLAGLVFVVEEDDQMKNPSMAEEGEEQVDDSSSVAVVKKPDMPEICPAE